ncbi:cullin-1 [Anaeramoeba flamelloides]|uniref:Cullin-1 n=1 Tax=Anaeramoeba flamelloides TaxID=1746091 RepID=A0ABQ8YTK6_9EUKA|nr:cullin-1 [Anaeramoeba flamelloides]
MNNIQGVEHLKEISKLKKYYEMLSKTNEGKKELEEIFTKQLQDKCEKCLQLINNEKTNQNNSDQNDIIAFIQLKQLIKIIIEKGFKNDLNLKTIFEKNFKLYISKNINTSKHLVLFLHQNLKNSSLNSDEENKKKINSALSLLLFIKDLSVFCQYYIFYFSQRLINKDSSIENENEILKNIGKMLGYEFIRRMEFMIKDIKLSLTYKEDFEKYLTLKENVNVRENENENENENINENINENVNVNVNENENIHKQKSNNFITNFLLLTRANWDLYNNEPQLHNFIENENSSCNLQSFFLNKFPKKKIFFLHSLSTVQLEASFVKKKPQIITSDYQAQILLCFNDTLTFNIDELKNKSQIDDNKIFSQTVISLIKNNILRSKPKITENGILTSDFQIQLNRRYATKRRIIRLKTPQYFDPKKFEKDEKIIQKNLINDRNLFLQLSIIQILKHKKSINHDSLIQEILQKANNKYQINDQLIIDRINFLINYKYLQKIEKQSIQYIYVNEENVK